MKIKDHLGNRVTIDSAVFKSAGQAKIHKIPNQNMVAKIYHKLDVSKRDRLNEKVLFMVQNPPFDATTPYEIVQSIVWPEKVLYDNANNFIGFTMPFINKSTELTILTIPSYSNKSDKIWSKFNSSKNRAFLKQRSAICYNVASVLQKIHESNRYVIVDLKPQNILIDIEGKISLIDIDSIQVTTPLRTYHADAWTEEYCPPEFFISQINPKQKRVNSDWDYFAFSVIVYQLFFQIHPFMGTVGTNSLVDNIKNRYFVHGKNSKVFSFLPPPHNGFSQLSLELQNYFKDTFDGQAYQRVSFDFWKQAFFAMQSKQIKAKPIHTPKASSKTTATIQATPSSFRTKFLKHTIVIVTLVGLVILFVENNKFTQEHKEITIDYGNLHAPTVATTSRVRSNRDVDITLKEAYSCTNKILTFSNVIKDGDRIEFSYKLTTIKPPTIKKSEGYIDKNSLKIYLDGRSGEIQKNSDGMLSIKLDGNLFF